MTISPMTADEAAAFLKGVEWMREKARAACAVVSDGAHPHADSDAHVAGDMIRAIPAPTVPRLGFGVLGEG